ncbi:MAG: 23S rRNA (uracil(1939)-C(5))-methyltransferase RlmD [Chloroflexi bacterium]|nr:23S rRNA (uracil(1939)-C(5))-methyltransferase RlmD [Chloroflexota bacterium]
MTYNCGVKESAVRRSAATTEARTLRVQLTDIAYGGDSIGRVDDQVIFVSFGIPNETVIATVHQAKRDFLRATVSEVVTSSAARIEPRCKYFGACGGCQWQHIDYQTQLVLKRKVVVDQLRRIGGFDGSRVESTLPSPEPWHYRNHARFSVGSGGRLGFTRAGTHSFLPVDHCALMHPAINDLLARMGGRLAGRFHQVAVRCGMNTDSLLVDPPVFVPGLSASQQKPFLEESLLGRRFRISGASFFQVNTPQAERLVQLVIDRIEPTRDDIVVDAYSGVGTFGLLVAGRVKQVFGIEDSGAALSDARLNAEGLENVRFVEGAVERVLPTIDKPVDCVIIDPPRFGCRRDVITELKRLRPRRIAYVSCDPATLARDLRLLCDQEFELTSVQPIDMFPQTYHVESLAILNGRNRVNWSEPC